MAPLALAANDGWLDRMLGDVVGKKWTLMRLPLAC
jgi:hypothetical protein